MRKETQNNIMVYSAVAMLVVGVTLNIAGFIIPPTGEISDSVLWVLAQSLMSYIDDKVDDISRKLPKVQGDEKN